MTMAVTESADNPMDVCRNRPKRTPQQRRITERYALLKTAEYFRGRLEYCDGTPRELSEWTRYRDIAWDALDWPSLIETDRIRSDFVEAGGHDPSMLGLSVSSNFGKAADGWWWGVWQDGKLVGFGAGYAMKGTCFKQESRFKKTARVRQLPALPCTNPNIQPRERQRLENLHSSPSNREDGPSVQQEHGNEALCGDGANQARSGLGTD